MFTGLIETLGAVVSITPSNAVHYIGVKPESANYPVANGGSVSVDGACLTLEREERGVLYFSAVAETMARTTLGLKRPGDKVNLERALALSGRLDGHFVLGHVDGVGRVRSRTDTDESAVYSVDVPEDCMHLMAEKGSIAIDGISLTIAAVCGNRVEIAVIPATLRATTLGKKRAGDRVNCEADVLARYVRTASARTAAPAPQETLLAKMERAGF